MCDIEKLNLGYRKCTDKENIKLTIARKTKKDEEEHIDICDKCWAKLCKNDKFYNQDQNA
jgi:hypothetical protein